MAAAVLAMAYTLLAIPLAFTIVQRAYIQGAITQPVPLSAAMRVCSLDPSNAECAARLAIMAEQYGATSNKLWGKALQLNPYDSSLMTQAALAYETSGDASRAERTYLEAARLSQTWLPRWSLANYYYRRNSPRDVAKWARLALERGHGDRFPLYSLCRSAGFTYPEILGGVLPRGHVPSIESFMAFLRSQPGSDEAFDTLTKAGIQLQELVAPGPAPNPGVDQLAYAVDHLIRQGEPERAHRIWQAMASRRLLPPEFSPGGGVLTDARFSGVQLAAPAFAWEMAKAEGVEVLGGTPPGGVKIELSGGQPEALAVLSQCVRLSGFTKWVLTFESSESGDQPAGKHFRWRLEDLVSHKELAPISVQGAGGGQWDESRLVWEVPPGTLFYRLRLNYQRPLGSSRMTGELRIRSLRLDGEGQRQ
jgi:tetratricopeptide (TPR) repeat protein